LGGQGLGVRVWGGRRAFEETPLGGKDAAHHPLEPQPKMWEVVRDTATLEESPLAQDGRDFSEQLR